MATFVELSGAQSFEASSADFVARARSDGWGFWRGLVVGFAAGFPLAYIAATGEVLWGIGA